MTDPRIWLGTKPRSQYLAGHKITRERLMDGETVTLSAYSVNSRYLGRVLFYQPCGRWPTKCQAKSVLYRVKVKLK